MLIETERLLIRPFKESDIPSYAAIVADAEVTHFLGDGHLQSPDEAAEYVHKHIRSEAQNGYSRYALWHRHSECLVGICGFAQLSSGVDMGWRVGRTFWGNGFATEAAREVLRYGRSVLNLSPIFVTVAVENRRSLRVVEKLGLHEYDIVQVGDWRCRRYVVSRSEGG